MDGASFQERRDETRRFLELLWGNATRSGDLNMFQIPTFRSLRLPSADLEAAAHEIAQAGLEEDIHIYLSCCLLSVESRANSGRGTKDDALMIAGIWADVDIAGPAHKSAALPPDTEAALELCLGIGLPPTLVVHSGHGLYPWWLFDKPRRLADGDGRERAHRLVQGAQAALAALAAGRGWQMDSTSDLARILRPPGTINRKVEGSPLPVQIYEEGGARYDPAQLIEAWGHHIPAPRALAEPLPDKIFAGQRTNSVASLAGTLRKRNVVEDAAMVAALEHNRLICEPPLPADKVRETVRGIYTRYEADGAPLTNGSAKKKGDGGAEAIHRLVRASTVPPRPVEWIWKPFLPAGKLVIHAGEPGMMKSTLDCAIGATLTRKGQRVIYLNYEDDEDDTLVPRLMAARADLDLVDFVPDDFTPGELVEVVRAIRPAAVFIDPFGSWAEETENTGAETQVRKALRPLKRLARETGAMVKVNCHPNKQNSLADALYRIAGSLGGMVGYGRVILASKRAEDGFLLGIVKSNAAPGGLAVEYRFQEVQVDVGIIVPRVSFGLIVAMERETFFAANDGEGRPTKAQDCAQAIQTLLADGQRYTKDIKAELLRQGFSADAIKRGALIAGVKTKGQGNGARWKLKNQISPGVSLAGQHTPDPDLCYPASATASEEDDFEEGEVP